MDELLKECTDKKQVLEGYLSMNSVSRGFGTEVFIMLHKDKEMYNGVDIEEILDNEKINNKKVRITFEVI
jgi:rRNA processing protein Krr1/Pno1